MKILPLGSTEEPPQLLLLCRSHGHAGGTRGRGDKATLPTHTAPQGPTGDKETPVSPRERNSPNLRAAGAAAPTAEPNLASPRDPPRGTPQGQVTRVWGQRVFYFPAFLQKSSQADPFQTWWVVSEGKKRVGGSWRSQPPEPGAESTLTANCPTASGSSKL